MRRLKLTSFAVLMLFGWSAAIATAQPQLARGRSTMDEALDIYAGLTGRTVLRPGFLPQLPESIASQVPADTNRAIEFIEGKLAANGVEVVRNGKLFAWILPEGWKETPLAAQLARIKPPPARENSAAGADDPLLSAGAIDFRAMPLGQVLDVYSEMRHRTVLRPAMLPPVRIQFSTRTSLTKEEAVYGLTVVLAMNGVGAVDDGEKFVQVVPVPRVQFVQAKAPKPKVDAAEGDPKAIPVFRPGFGGDLASRPTVNDLAAFYAGVTGRTPEVSAGAGLLPVWFEVRNPLTRDELIYAIETTLGLNEVVMVPGENDTVRVARVGELPMPATNSPAAPK